jgi:hypothetical protein
MPKCGRVALASPLCRDEAEHPASLYAHNDPPPHAHTKIAMTIKSPRNAERTRPTQRTCAAAAHVSTPRLRAPLVTPLMQTRTDPGEATSRRFLVPAIRLHKQRVVTGWFAPRTGRTVLVLWRTRRL